MELEIPILRFFEELYNAQKKNFIDLLESKVNHLESLLKAAQEQNDLRFNLSKEATTVAMASAEKAVQKAESASDKRFEGMNEIRGAMADAQRLNITRVESDAKFAALDEKIGNVTTLVNSLSSKLDKQEGKSGGITQFLGWIISGIIALVAILTLIFKFAG